MRLSNKYKLYSNFNISLRKMPLRLNNFKRPKWFGIKKKLFVVKQKIDTITARFSKMKAKDDANALSLNNKFLSSRTQKSNFPYFDLTKKILVSSYKGMPKVARLFKNKLQTKKYVKSLFDNSNLSGVNGVTYSNIDFLTRNMVKPFYRIDLLLWHLYYFSTPYQAINLLNNNTILVNGKPMPFASFLKKGDIVTFEPTSCVNVLNNTIINKKKYMINHLFFSFLELDYYSNSIIITKDLNELSVEDLTLLIEKPLFSLNLF